ncbi:uncharacterized protein LOC135378273 isoform X2 [Ornithodoros turicata]|uniref:uncharacterized protein LOC135378273 isoform X2 n=1 Tax=Ornithodoros turicata TaxID=34597 RepID=UPI003139BDB8
MAHQPAIDETFKQLRLNTAYVLSINGFLNILEVTAGFGNFMTYMIFGVTSKSQHFLYACSFGYSLNGTYMLISGLFSLYFAELLPVTTLYKLFQVSAMSMYLLGSLAVLTYDLPSMPDVFCGMAAGLFIGLMHMVHLIYLITTAPSTTF